MWKKIALIWLTAFWMLGFSLPPEKGSLALHFIDVGQADAILVQTGGGKNVLIDGGSDRKAAKVMAYLAKRNIDHLDMLIVTHPHHDHIGTLDEIIHAYGVNVLYMPPKKHRTRFFLDLQRAIRKNHVITLEARIGQTIKIDRHVRIDVIGPRGKKYDRLNDYSLVLRLTHQQNKFLLMGDTSREGEKDILLKNVNVNADVIKIGHHGAKSSTTEAFLDRVKPKYAIITAKVDTRGKFPSGHVLSRLAERDVKIFRTDRDGTIIVYSNGKKIEFRTEK